MTTKMKYLKMKIYHQVVFTFVILVFVFIGCQKSQNGSSITTNNGASSSSATRSSSNSATGNGSGNVLGSQDGLDPVSYSDSPLVEEFLNLVAEISARAPNLNRERDRRGKLRAELGANIGKGCINDIKIKSLEFIIDGVRLNDVDLSKRYEIKKLPQNHNGTIPFEFTFGDLTFTKSYSFTYDENEQSLFTPSGRKIIELSKENFVIGDLQRLRIKRMQNNFEVLNLCEGGKIFEGCKQIHKVTEVDRLYFSNLKIKVNEILVYQQGNINHAFSESSQTGENIDSFGLQWTDDNLNINEVFVKLSQKSDCTALSN